MQHRIKKMQLEIEKANNEKLCLEDEIFTLQENAINEKRWKISIKNDNKLFRIQML